MDRPTTITQTGPGFHDSNDAISTQSGGGTYQDTEFTYTFENFFHPFVGELIDKLNKKSLPGMLDPVFLEDLNTAPDDAKKRPDNFFKLFRGYYEKPEGEGLAIVEGFPKEIDVLESGAYANYNWELFFHVPLTIAVHLSKNQRFAEAQRWFHYIFDPTCNDTSIEAPRRFWKFLAFRNNADITQIDDLLMLLSSAPDSDAARSIIRGYDAIKKKPFQPHAVARTRHLAYQYCVVMKYLDNLIAWGDSLFRQDTIESINEATQLYVLAANLLGVRPQRIPPRGTTRPLTFAELKDKKLDAMGNALVELESEFPFNLAPQQTQVTTSDAIGPLFGIGRTLYFCIPRNDKMLGYWDTVSDRLFKIRHCMNIEGVVRQLALFDPPLDPGMLVKAAAAGIDIGSIVSGLNQPIGPMRAPLLIQKALELCGEVRGLGNALLSALEKGDAEDLALTRQRHENQIQQMAQEVRYLQFKSAQEATKSLLTSRSTALERLHYYQRLLGLPADPNAPETLTLDQSADPDDPPKLTAANFDEAFNTLVGNYDKTLTLQKLPALKLAGDTSPANQSGESREGRLYLNMNENTELNTHLPAARDAGTLASALKAIASALVYLPEFGIDVHFWGLGGHMIVFGGEKSSSALTFAADVLQIYSAREREQAGMVSKSASYERRADEWLLQYNLAAHEVMQNGRQILTSLIAEQTAHHEYHNIKQQIANTQEVDQLLHDKFTNEELYLWMQGEISRLYYEYYRFAFDTARKAEQTMKRELMRPEVDTTEYIKFNYWDGGRKGLLSGEALYLDVKRMEMAYHENNKREYELTKSVSLRQLNPLALLALKTTGACEVALPEWLFDLDAPGHYMRRIKNVSLSIPSVTGPYTSVNCTLTLLKSSLRKSPQLLDDVYDRQGSEDSRFVDYFGTIQSIVTSSANNDSGMFETNLRDERFLPFEGAGVESTWKLELPAGFRQFDYNTISDVILHVRYTARQGGAPLRDKTVAYLGELVGDANKSGLALMFSLRHDFPSEWHKFVTGNANFTATVKRDHFPYITQGKDINIDNIQLYAIEANKVDSTNPQGLDSAAFTNKLKSDGEFELSLAPDDVVLVRKQQAYVFIVIKYYLVSA